MQRYTVYFIWKLLYIFRVVPSPIIRSANNSISSIWYLLHRYGYITDYNDIWPQIAQSYNERTKYINTSERSNLTKYGPRAP
jgi:hypothetical protein